MELQSIFIDGKTVLLGLPSQIGNLKLFEYILMKVMNTEACTGYKLKILHKKLKSYSPHCEGYIKDRNVIGYCPKCAHHKFVQNQISNDKAGLTPHIHVDHSYSKLEKEDNITVPTKTDSSMDDEYEDEYLTDTDISDCEDDDPTYDPNPKKASSTLNSKPTESIEDIVDSFLEKVPGILNENGSSFRLLLINELRNSGGEKRRRRWDTG